jgi:hypothetical protein
VVSLVNAIYNCGQYYPVDTALLEGDVDFKKSA